MTGSVGGSYSMTYFGVTSTINMWHPDSDVAIWRLTNILAITAGYSSAAAAVSICTNVYNGSAAGSGVNNDDIAGVEASGNALVAGVSQSSLNISAYDRTATSAGKRGILS